MNKILIYFIPLFLSLICDFFFPKMHFWASNTTEVIFLHRAQIQFPCCSPVAFLNAVNRSGDPMAATRRILALPNIDLSGKEVYEARRLLEGDDPPD